MTRPVRRFHVGRFLGALALDLAALGGLVCIILVPLALFFNISLVMFKTGSMAPTITAGSLAVVREIPASEIAIGDVVTVDRADALPVTHRVTSVEMGPTAEERTITLKGDANAVEDPAPYTVSTVRLTMFSIPGLAYVVVWFSNPFVLGALTLAVTALVTWAFWPRAQRLPREEPVLAGPKHEAGHRGRLARHGAARRGSPRPPGALLLVALLCVAGLTVGAPPARAAETDTIVAGPYITLTSVADLDELSNMTPGKTVRWQVGVQVNAPRPGTVTLSLSATGSAALGLTMQSRSCTARWVAGACPGTSVALQPDHVIPVDGVDRTLTTMSSSQVRWFLFDVTMPATSTEVTPGESLSMIFHARGVEDDVTVGPGELATTGAGPMPPWPAMLAAIGAIGLGPWPCTARHRAQEARGVRGARIRRRAAAGLALVGLAVLALTPVARPELTRAGWTDSEYGTGTLTAGTVSPASNLSCSAGFLQPVVYNWSTPSGGVTRTGYRWTAIGSGGSLSGTLPAGATTITLRRGDLGTGSGTFTLWAAGPGTWESTPVSGSYNVNIFGYSSCSVP